MNFRFYLLSLMSFCSLGYATEVLISGENGVQVSDIDIRAESMKVPEGPRRTYFGQAKGVSASASNLYTRRALAAEAERNKLDQQPEIAAALRIARDRVLSDARIAEIDKSAVPNAQALESYARAVYASKPERFRMPAEVHVAHILIPATQPDAAAVAAQVRMDVLAGADFAAIAREKSADPVSAQKGGDLGFIKPRQMVVSFDQAAFALTQSGDVSPVVESQFGFHVIRLLEKRAARVQPFEEAKEGLMAEAKVKLMEEARAAKSAKLLESAKFNEKAIEDAAAGFR